MSPRPSPQDPPQQRTVLTSPVTSAFAGGLNAGPDARFNANSYSSGAAAGPSWSAPRRADRVGKGAKGGPENALHGFRGVRQRSWGKWVAEIRAPRSKKRVWLGSFADARTAALTYDRAARKLYGVRAQLNFLDEGAVSAPTSSHSFGSSLRGADARSGLISSGSGSGGSASDSEGGAFAGVLTGGAGGGGRTSRSVETPAHVPRCASSDDATPPSLARFALPGGAPFLTRDSNPAESAVSAAMTPGSRTASLNVGSLAAARCDYIGGLPLPSMTFQDIFNRSCPPLSAPAATSTSVSALGARAPPAEKRGMWQGAVEKRGMWQGAVEKQGMWQGPVESFRAPAASSAGRVDPSAESGKAVSSRELARGMQQQAEESVACSGWSHGGGVATHSIVNWNQKNQDRDSSQGFFAVAGNEGANTHFPPCPAVLPAQLSQQPALAVHGGLVPYGSSFASPPVMSVVSTDAPGGMPEFYRSTQRITQQPALAVRGGLVPYGSIFSSRPVMPVGGTEAFGMSVPWGCGTPVPWVQERTMVQQGAMAQEGVMVQDGAMVQALRESRAQLVREQMGGSGGAVTAENAWNAGNAWTAGSAGAGVQQGAMVQALRESRAQLVREQMDSIGVEHGVLDAAAIERMLQLSEALLGPADPPPHGPHIPHGHRDPHPHGANAPRGPVVTHASDAAALKEASALLAYGDYQCLTTGLPDAIPSCEPSAVPRSLHVSLPGSVPHAAAAVAACEPACGLADLVPPVSPSPLCMGGELTVPGSHCMLPPAVCMAPCEPASSAVNALTIDVAQDDQPPCFEELLSPMSRLW
ncbi:unnamed protein product [Closterium sp. Naga37s-1]|nr:unnamed protein product [Closterium sp. Naga37s-1]